MFRSVRTLQKFIKTKNYIFEDRASVRKDFMKTLAAYIGVSIPFYYLFLEFVMFPPDIAYDIRCAISPDFYQYARTRGLLLHEKGLYSAIRTFKIGDDGSKVEAETRDFKHSFVDID